MDGRGLLSVRLGRLLPERSVTSQAPNLVLLGTLLGIRGDRYQAREARVVRRFNRDRLRTRVP